MNFPDDSVGKEFFLCLQCIRRRRCRFSPWVGKMPWRSMGTHLGIFAWKILWTEEPCGLQSISSVQFSSVTQSCPTLWDPMNRSMPGLPVHHQLPEFTQTHVHQVDDAIQPSLPLSSPSLPVPNPSQHQGLFQWVNSSCEVAKVLEFQLQHQSFQWTPRTDLS